MKGREAVGIMRLCKEWQFHRRRNGKTPVWQRRTLAGFKFHSDIEYGIPTLEKVPR